MSETASVVPITCACGRQLKVPAAAIGHAGRCPYCHATVRTVAPGWTPGAPGFDARLVLVQGPRHVGEQFVLGGREPIEVGKLPDRHIHLIDNRISRAHCRLVRSANGWRIEDNRSTNGVYVNDERVPFRLLQDGDLVHVGEHILRFEQIATASQMDTEPSLPEPTAAPAGPGIAEPEVPSDAFDEEADGDDLYGLVAAEDAVPASPAPRVERKTGLPVEETGEKRVCPGCERKLPSSAKICIDCGIDLRTGKPLLTSAEGQLDDIYVAAESFIRRISWIVVSGVFPIASEALGTRRPYFTWGVAVLTTIVSMWYWIAPSADTYRLELWPDERFHPAQLVTVALLHADVFHLVCNMVFLLVFGARVNALVGNLPMLLLYPALTAAASMAQLMATGQMEPARPMIGASGATMGLAGMYFVLLPAHKVHVAAWMRFGIFAGFRLFYRLFAVRGFWIVLFYIAFDAAAVTWRVESNVGHWAHLGGFIAGMVVALVLLVSRLVNCRGGDLLTMQLGRRAWPLVGKPDLLRPTRIAQWG